MGVQRLGIDSDECLCQLFGCCDRIWLRSTWAQDRTYVICAPYARRGIGIVNARELSAGGGPRITRTGHNMSGMTARWANRHEKLPDRSG